MQLRLLLLLVLIVAFSEHPRNQCMRVDYIKHCIVPASCHVPRNDHTGQMRFDSNPASTDLTVPMVCRRTRCRMGKNLVIQGKQPSDTSS